MDLVVWAVLFFFGTDGLHRGSSRRAFAVPFWLKPRGSMGEVILTLRQKEVFVKRDRLAKEEFFFSGAPAGVAGDATERACRVRWASGA